MADMKFGANLHPNTTSTYSLGTSSKKWDNIYLNKINNVDAAVVSSLRLLLASEIEGTTQTPTISDGNLTKIVHKDGSNNTIRTDTISVSSSQVTETRVLNTGETAVITTNLSTLVTTIAYTAA